eukprot:jgi/Botrbrau1/9373/Bobra.0252s0002.1
MIDACVKTGKCFTYAVRPSQKLPSQLRQLITRSARGGRSSACILNPTGYGPTLIRMSDGAVRDQEQRVWSHTE